ncbi:hypothetical protein SEEH5111_06997 [Salmonella enterica subsp. enterica serovar Heidelberg str. 640151-11]|nr:hypothetical protein SEEH5111_06997 [Salmonella enterica subsp. enterica serovar Heidelberg str. 640151-11]
MLYPAELVAAGDFCQAQKKVLSWIKYIPCYFSVVVQRQVQYAKAVTKS